MTEDKLLISTLQGKQSDQVPFWFMRQAGRFLPEYKATRATASGFLDLCFSPEKAAEVTLQPLRRFGMSAAILFSDILVIPYALGVDVRFAEGEGPIVEVTNTKQRIDAFQVDKVRERLEPVAQTVRLVKKELPKGGALIGFAGAPWTVACYMLQGKSGKEFAKARQFAQAEPVLMQSLIDKITDATIEYLKMQIDAGAEAIQIFDSWSGLLSPAQFAVWCIKPTTKIVKALRAYKKEIPIIGFPKGAGLFLKDYAQTGVDCFGIDMNTPMEWAKQNAQGRALQGNLDPLLLCYDLKGALDEAKRILETMKDSAFVFNLGHGMIPEMPISHVEALSNLLKEYRR
ncbi:MAG: uroporphyrinogen decarboxylase [Alphaproteobacteria bacterium]|nr:uroporphyrinogen decarboxylase [Alphaproteobacteria bacterium]